MNTEYELIHNLDIPNLQQYFEKDPIHKWYSISYEKDANFLGRGSDLHTWQCPLVRWDVS